MSKKVRVIFEGLINDLPTVKQFQNLLVQHGSKALVIVDKLEQADMKVDISEIRATSDLYKEVIYVIKAAKGIQRYEIKRKRIIKEAKSQTNKLLLATSRKNIN